MLICVFIRLECDKFLLESDFDTLNGVPHVQTLSFSLNVLIIFVIDLQNGIQTLVTAT
jgi:SpoU rRNA methylase family enzyme